MPTKKWIRTTEESVSHKSTRMQTRHVENARQAEDKMRRHISSVQLDLRHFLHNWHMVQIIEDSIISKHGIIKLFRYLSYIFVCLL